MACGHVAGEKNNCNNRAKKIADKDIITVCILDRPISRKGDAHLAFFPLLIYGFKPSAGCGAQERAGTWLILPAAVMLQVAR